MGTDSDVRLGGLEAGRSGTASLGRVAIASRWARSLESPGLRERSQPNPTRIAF